MKSRSRLLQLAVVALLILHASHKAVATSQGSALDLQGQHVAWVLESLGRMEVVKVGMTRGDLLKVFETEAGLYSRGRGHYAFRGCPYFKVDVEFEAVGPGVVGRSLTEGSQADVIKSVSRPYIQRMILN